MEKLKTTVFKIDKFLCYIASTALVIVMAIVTVHVAMRLSVSGAIAGLTDYVGVIFAVLIVCAIPYVESVNGHIRVDFLREKLPVKIQRGMYLVLEGITIVFIFIVVITMLQYMMNCYHVGSMTMVVFIKFWPFVLISAIGMFFYFLTSIVNVASEVSNWSRKEEPAL